MVHSPQEAHTHREAEKFILVSREPTHAMLTAASDAIGEAQKQGWFGLSPIDIYRTMIAAAPKPDDAA